MATANKPQQKEYTTAELTNKNPQFRGFDYETDFQKALQKRVPRTWILIIILAALNVMTGLINDSFVPAIQEIAKDYSVEVSHVQKLVSLYIVGMGIGQLFWGPFIDRFGRKILAVLVTILGVVTNILFVLVPHAHPWSIEVLGTLRVIQGLVFSGFAVLPSVIIKDIVSPRRFFVLNSWLVTIFMFAPGLAPLIGSGILMAFGEWQMIFNIISAIVIIVGLIFLVTIPETLDPEKRQAFNTKRIVLNYAVITTNPKSILIILLNCILSCLIFSFPTMLPAIFMIDYGMSRNVFSIFPFIIVCCVIFSVRLNQVFIRRGHNPVKLWSWGSWWQLLACVVNLLIAFGVFGHLNPTLIMIGLVFSVLCNPFILGNSFGIYLMDYSNMSGTATSWLTSLRLLISGLIINGLSDLPREGGATFLVSNVIIMFIVVLLSVFIRRKFLRNLENAPRRNTPEQDKANEDSIAPVLTQEDAQAADEAAAQAAQATKGKK